MRTTVAVDPAQIDIEPICVGDVCTPREVLHYDDPFAKDPQPMVWYYKGTCYYVDDTGVTTRPAADGTETTCP